MFKQSMPLLEACLALATDEERATIEAAIQAGVLEPGGGGIFVAGGENKKYDERARVCHDAETILTDILLNRIIADPARAVIGVDQWGGTGEPREVSRYFLVKNATHINWTIGLMRSAWRDDGKRQPNDVWYDDLAVESRESSTGSPVEPADETDEPVTLWFERWSLKHPNPSEREVRDAARAEFPDRLISRQRARELLKSPGSAPRRRGRKPRTSP